MMDYIPISYMFEMLPCGYGSLLQVYSEGDVQYAISSLFLLKLISYMYSSVYYGLL